MGKQRAEVESKTGESPPGHEDFTLISNEKLRALYAGLLKCKAMREQDVENGNGKPASMRGREAAVVGSTIDLGPGDTVCSVENGFLTGFSAGATIANLLLRPGHHQPLRASNTADAAGRNGTSPSAAGVTGTHSAIGAALANKTNTNRKVAMYFSTEASAETMREALHIATVHALPMVFVHHAEGGSEKPKRKKRGSKKQDSSNHKTPWFPSIAVDRDDVVAVYRVAGEAISRARLGRGPTLIECQPYRLNGSRAHRNGVHAEDPILHMEHYLRTRGLFDPS